MTFLDFQTKLATPNRVQSSKRKVAEHRATFERAAKEFGVPASVITGFWALESDFGAGMGKLPILPSLVALAYDCRRGEMFTEELIAALQIMDRGDMSPSGMIGSWAGEIGQTQFLPTRYLDYAIDYDGDGRINLFSNDDDVIGSTANYMKNLGWRPNEPWIEEVRVTKDLPWDKADLAIKLPRSQWAQWGIQYPDGSAVPADDMQASLLLPMGRNGPAFLAYPNFDIYTEWNNSLSYATTAAYLATRIDGAGAMSRGRGDTNGLDAAQTKELQQILASRGYDVGKIDGLAGAKTRAAVKDMQIKLELAGGFLRDARAARRAAPRRLAPPPPGRRDPSVQLDDRLGAARQHARQGVEDDLARPVQRHLVHLVERAVHQAREQALDNRLRPPMKPIRLPTVE